MTRNRLVPLIVAVALFMENMDSTVIATSLPAIAADLGTSPLTLKLAVTSYLLSLAVFIPISGWTADRFGTRTVFRAAIAVFVLGSIGCALSQSVTQFVIARIVQGMGGAMMTPVGRLVLVRTIDRRELVNAMAWVSMPAMVGPLLGPPLGGFITTYASWHWIFLINVPMGLAGIWLVTRYIEDIRAETPERFDLTGMVLSGLAVAGLAFGLSVAGLDLVPWSFVVGLLVGGAIAFVLYLRHAQRTPAPVLDFSLLKLPTFRASLFGGFLFRIGVGALPFLLPLLLQVGFHLTPFQSGMITFTATLGAIGMKTSAATILKRFGFRAVLTINALLSAVFIAACAVFSVATPFPVMIAILLVGGFFRSLQFTAVNAIAYAEVPAEKMSRATSLAAVGQQVSLSAGVAIGALTVEMMGRFKEQPIDRRLGLSGRISRGRGDRRGLDVDLRAPAQERRRGDGRPHAVPERVVRSSRGLTKAGREHVKLGRIRPARRRLDVLHACEVALEHGEQRSLRAALDHLGEEASAGFEHLAGEICGGLNQRHDLEMIGRTVTGGVRRHIGQHHVGRTAEHGLEPVRRLRIEKVDLRKLHAGNLVHFENVDGDDAALVADALYRDLAPAAGRGTEIDHATPGLEEMLLVVDLGELERRARAETFALRARDIGVVELAFEPERR